MACGSQSPEALFASLPRRCSPTSASPPPPFWRGGLGLLERWPRATGRQGRSSARTRRVRMRREASGNLGRHEP